MSLTVPPDTGLRNLIKTRERWAVEFRDDPDEAADLRRIMDGFIADWVRKHWGDCASVMMDDGRTAVVTVGVVH